MPTPGLARAKWDRHVALPGAGSGRAEAVLRRNAHQKEGAARAATVRSGEATRSGLSMLPVLLAFIPGHADSGFVARRPPNGGVRRNCRRPSDQPLPAVGAPPPSVKQAVSSEVAGIEETPSVASGDQPRSSGKDVTATRQGASAQPSPPSAVMLSLWSGVLRVNLVPRVSTPCVALR